MRRGERWLVVLGVGTTVGLAGCSEKLSERDCVAIRDRLQGAWEADANEAAALAETEQFRRFVKDESARIGSHFMGECQKLVGSEIDRAEVACLRRAARIDDVPKCEPR
jgi:hypothetical protein